MSVPASKDEPERLPLRWLVILLTATAVGVLAADASGVAGGVGAGAAVAGLLHAIVK